MKSIVPALALCSAFAVPSMAQSNVVVRHVAAGGSTQMLLVDSRAGRLFAMRSISYENFGGYPAITVFDTRSGARVGTIRLPGGAEPSTAAIDERRGRMIVGGFAGKDRPATVSIVDTHSLRILATLVIGSRRTPAFVHTPQVIAVETRLGHAFVARVDGAVMTLDVKTARIVRFAWVARYPTSAAVDEQTHHVFVGSNGFPTHVRGSLAMLDTRSGRLLHRIRTAATRGADGKWGDSTDVLAVSRRDHKLWVRSGRQVSLFDTTSGKHLRPMFTSRDWGLIDPLLGRLYVLTEGRLLIADAATGRTIRRVSVLPSGHIIVRYPARWQVLVVGGKGITIVDARTGRLIRTLPVDLAGHSTLAGAALDERHGRLCVGSVRGRIVILPVP